MKKRAAKTPAVLALLFFSGLGVWCGSLAASAHPALWDGPCENVPLECGPDHSAVKDTSCNYLRYFSTSGTNSPLIFKGALPLAEGLYKLLSDERCFAAARLSIASAAAHSGKTPSYLANSVLTL